MLLELLFNALLDRLMPLEFDGTAHVRVSLADPRLQPLRLLRWEMANAQRLAASVLPPAQHMLARADVRDKLARLAQCALRALGAAFELPACGPAADEILRSRRCFRWVEGVTQLLVLYEQPSSWDEPRFATALGVGSRLGRLGFVWLENTRWLQQYGFLHGSNESTARRAHVRCLAAGYACSLLLAVSRAARCGETRGDSERASRPQREACRHLLLLLQARAMPRAQTLKLRAREVRSSRKPVRHRSQVAPARGKTRLLAYLGCSRRSWTYRSCGARMAPLMG